MMGDGDGDGQVDRWTDGQMDEPIVSPATLP